jgi:hypothetical protein
VIDTGQSPYESRNISPAVRNVTSMPVCLVIEAGPMLIILPGRDIFSAPRR